jgi:signal transduction histidine kinase
LSLINDILDLSKIEAGKLVFETGTVNIPDAVEAGLVMLRDKASKAHVSLHSEIEPGITKIIADERKLKQILSNLIGNAIKFSNEQGHVRVRVSAAGLEDFKAHCVTPGTIEPHLGQFVRFSVEDDGVGIGAEDIGNLFQPFVQLDGSLSRRHEGSGLGLHLSRQLVELHGGCIWAESEPGKGSTFSFIIPCAPRD